MLLFIEKFKWERFSQILGKKAETLKGHNFSKSDLLVAIKIPFESTTGVVSNGIIKSSEKLILKNGLMSLLLSERVFISISVTIRKRNVCDFQKCFIHGSTINTGRDMAFQSCKIFVHIFFAPIVNVAKNVRVFPLNQKIAKNCFMAKTTKQRKLYVQLIQKGVF